MELRHYHKRKHLDTTTFHWTFFIATQQRGISYLLTSYAIHHFSVHNSYFTRRPLMLSWSIWSYQGLRREGCYRWAIPQSNNRRSMESLIMVSPTLSSSSQQTWSNNNLWLYILFTFAMITQYWGLPVPAHTATMSHPYTTSPSDIFAPFHLKCAIRLAISLIAHGYNFIETNPGKRNLIKLTNNQATQENWSTLNVVQFA